MMRIAKHTTIMTVLIGVVFFGTPPPAKAEFKVRIREVDNVATSYPGFDAQMRGLGFRLETA